MALHIAALAIWCAGLVYLPGLYAMDTRMEQQKRARRQLRIMSRFAFLGIASPAAIFAIITGTALVYATGASGNWLAAKLTVVAALSAFHVYCGHLLAALGHEGTRKKRYDFGPWLVLVPVALIAIVLWLVLAKPPLFVDAHLVFENQLPAQPSRKADQQDSQ
jgi:putative membrane protein